MVLNMSAYNMAKVVIRILQV